MELKEKAISLAEELGIDFGEVHRVIGVSASTLEAAFNGHKKPLTALRNFSQTVKLHFSNIQRNK